MRLLIQCFNALLRMLASRKRVIRKRYGFYSFYCYLLLLILMMSLSSDESRCWCCCLSTRAKVTGLYRYAVKGLSGDSLSKVVIKSQGETFPDDRRFALLKLMKEEENKDDGNDDVITTSTTKPSSWEEGNWLHKENFLCAFTAPKLLAQLKSSYSIVTTATDENEVVSHGTPCDKIEIGVDDDVHNPTTSTQRILTLQDRVTGKHIFDRPLNLQIETDRTKLADYLSERSKQKVVCITGGTNNKNNNNNNKDQRHHTHQFGNTSSGYKLRGDTRTVHIINAATVRELSGRIFVGRHNSNSYLNPTRFRPNIIIENCQPWIEFDWVQNRQQLREPQSGLVLTVISKTVRCKGVSIDPLLIDKMNEEAEADNELDIPALIVEHFPQYGPYLGVYAVIDSPGTLALGDSLEII